MDNTTPMMAKTSVIAPVLSGLRTFTTIATVKIIAENYAEKGKGSR